MIHELVDPNATTITASSPVPDKDFSRITKLKDDENQVIPVRISTFDSPIEFKYPVGVNTNGTLEYKTYIEYEGNHRTKRTIGSCKIMRFKFCRKSLKLQRTCVIRSSRSNAHSCCIGYTDISRLFI